MARSSKPPSMDKIVSLCRRRGFVFQSSEIYGGLNATLDYGPLGVELKWRGFLRCVYLQPDVVQTLVNKLERGLYPMQGLYGFMVRPRILRPRIP